MKKYYMGFIAVMFHTVLTIFMFSFFTNNYFTDIGKLDKILIAFIIIVLWLISCFIIIIQFAEKIEEKKKIKTKEEELQIINNMKANDVKKLSLQKQNDIQNDIQKKTKRKQDEYIQTLLKEIRKVAQNDGVYEITFNSIGDDYAKKDWITEEYIERIKNEFTRRNFIFIKNLNDLKILESITIKWG